MNVSILSSILVGNGISRSNDGHKDKCVERLIRLGVLDVQPNFNLRLQVAQPIDAHYLTLISDWKQELEKSGEAEVKQC